LRRIEAPVVIQNVTGQYQTLRELAYTSVRHAILSGQFRPGDVLREQNLAGKLGVSKTPVREALRELEREGLATSTPHRGVVVVGLSPAAVREIYEMRGALEPLAASLAADRLTEEGAARVRDDLRQMAGAAEARDHEALRLLNVRFHTTLYELCGNARLRRTLLDLQDHVETIRTVEWSVPGGFEKNHEQHVAIGQAVLGRRPDEAGALMRDHLLRGLELLATGDEA
jgi:DNA-binding GntR family transcriptional regulator